MSEKDLERFFSKVKKTPECWLWIGSTCGANSSYPSFYLDGKSQRGHRVLFEHINGPISKGLTVCHRCDNPLCVNPKHLFLGSQKDNIHDCIKKDRFAKGERKGNAVLNEVAVRCMRWLNKHEGIGNRKLSAAYGCSRWAVINILRNKVWKWVVL